MKELKEALARSRTRPTTSCASSSATQPDANITLTEESVERCSGSSGGSQMDLDQAILEQVRWYERMIRGSTGRAGESTAFNRF